MYTSPVREAILGLKAYVPGTSIAEIKEKYGLTQVIKMASNENPLGTSPLVCEAVQRAAALSFRYPQGGNPRLTAALGRRHGAAPERIVVGNGSDEVIDLLLRVRWWDFAPERLAETLPLLCDPDLDKVRRALRDMLAETE